MIYFGKVTRVIGSKMYVTVNDLGGKDEFGPLRFVANVTKLGPEETSYVTNEADNHTHTIDKIDVPSNIFNKGDNVVVAQIGNFKDELVVLGKLM